MVPAGEPRPAIRCRCRLPATRHIGLELAEFRTEPARGLRVAARYVVGMLTGEGRNQTQHPNAQPFKVLDNRGRLLQRIRLPSPVPTALWLVPAALHPSLTKRCRVLF